MQILLLIIPVGLMNIYWTSTGWIILNILFLSIIFIMVDKYEAKRYMTFAIIISIIFIFFVPMIQTQLIRIFILQAYGGPIEGLYAFIDRVINILPSTGQSVDTGSAEKQGMDSIGSLIWNSMRLIRYTLLFTTLFVLLILHFNRRNSGIYAKEHRWMMIFIIVIMFTAVSHTGLYLARGNLSLRYISLMFPIVILTIFSFEQIHSKTNMHRRANQIGVVFACIALVGFLGFAVSGTGSQPGYISVSDGSDWMLEHTSDDYSVISDFHSVGAMRVLAAEDDRQLHPGYYDQDTYNWITEGEGTPPDSQYVVVNVAHIDKPVQTTGWQSFPPFGSTDSLYIEKDKKSNKIFSDKKVYIYNNTSDV